MSDCPIIAVPASFPPAWAGGWGEDGRGVYAELVLGKVTVELRWIPPGEFVMGSPASEAGRWEDEGPQHRVTLTRGYWIATTPCTQEQWQAVMGKNPSEFKGPRRPVENVDWHQAMAFCAKLTERARKTGCLPEGFDFRLPTEAEWEYACRAGTTSAFNDGSNCTEPTGKDTALERLGWFDETSKNESHPVGEKLPNAWSLHDMHGNVWEWCVDGKREYTSEAQTDPLGPEALDAGRVVRGGSCWSEAGYCRSASRFAYGPGNRYGYQGFRLAAGQPPGRGAPSPAAGGAVAPVPEAPAARPASGASRPLRNAEIQRSEDQGRR